MFEKIVKFTVNGEPMGKGRPRFSTFNGFVRTHTPKDTINYESKVVYAYKSEYKERAFDPHEQVVAYINAYYQVPKNAYRYYKRENVTKLTKQGLEMVSGNIRPTKKPDCDNIAKIILDALNGIAYHDDSQVIELSVSKHYAEEPRVEVELRSSYEVQ